MTERLKIYPACLPFNQRTENVGFHSGWSNPIPFHILSTYGTGFTKFYRDFFKQVQYKMDIQDKCEDSDAQAGSNDPFDFPTNTYYPPGTRASQRRYIYMKISNTYFC